MEKNNNREVFEKIAKEVLGAKTPEGVEKAVKMLIKSFM